MSGTHTRLNRIFDADEGSVRHKSRIRHGWRPDHGTRQKILLAIAIPER
jgi:hypothetical protein